MPNHVKRHLKSLFKLFTNKRRKDSTDESIQKWRDLSPSRPPLPFLPPESLHLDNDTSCSDTSEANSTENTPSKSIYIPHHSHSSRELHIIYEESEPGSQTNSSNSNETIQVSPPPLPSPSIISEPHQGDQGELLLESKQIFCRMVQDVYDYGIKFEHPKVFELLFDQNENICGVQLILKNGRKMNHLGFEGYPQYIAPELSVNNNTTFNHELADVWALGITLYELLIGRSPFTTEFNNHKQLFQRMMIQDLDIPNDVSEDAKDLLQKMICPASSRASLEAVMFHPWLRSCRFRTRKKKSKRKNKFYRVVRHAVRFIVKGPYPPPPKKYT